MNYSQNEIVELGAIGNFGIFEFANQLKFSHQIRLYCLTYKIVHCISEHGQYSMSKLDKLNMYGQFQSATLFRRLIFLFLVDWIRSARILSR